MKNEKHFISLVASLCAVLSACGSSSAPVQPISAPAEAASATDDLNTVVRETSDYLNKQLPKGNKLLILNIQSEFPALSEYIIDELIANTVNDRIFSVVDRQQLDAIRAELGFQMSGEVDDATAQALGRIAGAQIIISGAVSRIGDLYRLRVRALSVQSAQIEGQFNRNVPNNPTIAALVQSKATGYGGGTTTATNVGSRTPASAPTTVTATPVPAADSKTGKIIDSITTRAGSGTVAVSSGAGGSVLCIQSRYNPPYPVPANWDRVGSFELETYSTTVSKRKASGERYSIPIGGGSIPVTTLISFADIWDYEVFHYQIHDNSQRRISINSNNNGRPTIFIVAVWYAVPSTRVTMTPAEGVTVFDDPSGSGGFRAVVHFLVQEDKGGAKTINVSDYSRGDGRTLVVGLYLK